MIVRGRRVAGMLLSSLLIPLGPAVGQQAQLAPTPGEADLAAATATITAGDARARLALLSDDALLGRSTPSPGLDSALAYAAAEFRRLGLEPAGDAGGYLQHYPLVRWRLRPEAVRLAVTGDGPTTGLRYGEEFAIPPAAAGFDGELLFLGAVGAGPLALDDMAGRVGVVIVPGELDREWNRRVVATMQAAMAADAAGLLVVVDAAMDGARLGALAASFEGWRSRLEPIPAVLIAWSAARELLAGAGADLDALSATAAGDTAPVALGVTAALDQPLEEWDARPANALALLQGADPSLADQLVVVTAHIDHVGVGRPDEAGDSIYNGADDNASGTVGLLEIAEAFAALEQPSPRPVLFAAVSGEELGLLGSRWLADHLPDGTRAVANVNLDMISRNAPDTLAVVGQALSDLGPLLHRVAGEHPELGFTIVETVNPELPIIRMSDQAAFLDRGVPALFFNSGLHPDLHQPSDEADRSDPDKMARAARLAFLLTHAIARLPAPPALTEAGLRWSADAPRR